MRTSDLLRDARALIQRGWTRGILARDEHGSFVTPNSPSARCWCANGAISAAANCDSWPDDQGAPAVCYMALEYLSQTIDGCGAVGVYVYNDDLQNTQADVLRRFDEAILLAEKDEAL